MKINITGSRGFIGSRLVELLKDDHEIVEYDRNIDEDHDIENWEPDGCEVVVHLAGLANVRKSIEEPKAYWHNNVELSKRLFSLAHRANMRILYASSSCAKQWWLSPYGTSKRAMEAVAPSDSLGMRFTTVYGQNSRKEMLVGRIRDKKLAYVTNHSRDFIHVDDICSAIIKNLDNTVLAGTIDVGTGKSVGVKELAESVGINVPLVPGDTCEAQDNTADITPLLSTGWKPKYDVMEFVKGL